MKRHKRIFLLLLCFLLLPACQSESEVPVYGSSSENEKPKSNDAKNKNDLSLEDDKLIEEEVEEDPYEKVNSFIDESLEKYRDLMVDGWNKELLEMFSQPELTKEDLEKRKNSFVQLKKELASLRDELESFKIPMEIESTDKEKIEVFQRKLLESVKVLENGNKMMLEMIEKGAVDSEKIGEEISDMGDLLDQAIEALDEPETKPETDLDDLID